MSKEPLTEERIAEIRSRLHGVSLGEWSHGYSLDVKCNAITCEGRYLFCFVHPDPLKNDKNMEFVAYARQDMNALLDEVERLRAENEVLEKALEDLGFFVRTKLDYCPADFIGEGIDKDTDFTCYAEYDPDSGSIKCYGDCWADAFRNQAENDIRKFEEWKLSQEMEEDEG